MMNVPLVLPMQRSPRMTTRRLIVSAIVGAAIATCQAPAFAKFHKCVDPVTKAVNITDIACPQEGAPTPAEAAASAEAARIAAIAEEARLAAERADRQLLEKYPDEATHRKAERAEIEDAVRKIRLAMKRYDAVTVERKPLDEQTPFYVGKPLPPTLRRAIDANDASFAALTDVFRGLEMEVNNIVARYKSERERLRKRWGGAPSRSN